MWNKCGTNVEQNKTIYRERFLLMDWLRDRPIFTLKASAEKWPSAALMSMVSPQTLRPPQRTRSSPSRANRTANRATRCYWTWSVRTTSGPSPLHPWSRCTARERTGKSRVTASTRRVLEGPGRSWRVAGCTPGSFGLKGWDAHTRRVSTSLSILSWWSCECEGSLVNMATTVNGEVNAVELPFHIQFDPHCGNNICTKIYP